MGQLITYVGSYWVGNPTLLENEEAVSYCLRKLYYLYKGRLEETIRQLPYDDRRLTALYTAFPSMYNVHKVKCFPEEYPITKEELEGRFKYLFYDRVTERLVNCRIEIENDRYYFINYCKKRRYEVADDFYDCVLQDGEVILSKIAPQFRRIVPVDFVEKCHLRLLP